MPESTPWTWHPSSPSLLPAKDNTNRPSPSSTATPPRIQTFLTSFEDLTSLSLHTVLRLTILIGGYILLRPLIELGFRRLFATQEQSDSRPQSSQSTQIKSLADEHLKQSPTKPAPEGDEGAKGEKEAPTLSWGDSARQKQQAQRQKFMEAWEAEQAARAEDGDLDDIADVLED